MKISSFIQTLTPIVYNNTYGVQTQNKTFITFCFVAFKARIICQGLKFISIFEAVMSPEGSPIP
jgi:hypothetical protein